MKAFDIEQSYTSTEDDVYDDAPEYVDYLIYDDGYIEQEPRWTRKRIIWLIIAIVVIVAMVVLLVAPFIQSVIVPTPTYMPPPVTPPSQL